MSEYRVTWINRQHGKPAGVLSLIFFAFTISLLGLAGCGSDSTAPANPTVAEPVAVSVVIQPQNDASYPFRIPRIDPDTGDPQTFNFKAWQVYSDDSMIEVTGSVRWSSSNPAAMTISNTAPNQGKGTAVANGLTTITATLAGPPQFSGSTPVKVVTAISGSTIPRYVEPLPIPAVMQPTAPGGTSYTMSMEQVIQQVLPPTYPQTTLWGYGPPGACTYPGPTFVATSNTPISVTWNNNLPATQLLPIDYSIMGAEFSMPQNRAVVHLHGGNEPAAFDGTPEQWFTPGLAQKGRYFETNVYDYSNQHEPTTLWYHDHALGVTRLNTYAGLAGFYIITNAAEAAMNLPSLPKYQMGIVIQDRNFYDDGSLAYPLPLIDGVQPSIMPENFGNTIVVNGKSWPFLNVEPRKYRFRLLNGSSARFYHFIFDNAGTNLPFRIIGTEGGFLNAPVQVTDLTFAPGERYDVVVDFSGIPVGTNIIMRNDAPTPWDPQGQIDNPLPPSDPCAQIMQFRVVARTASDTSVVPASLRPGNPITPPDPATATVTRNMTLVEVKDQYGRTMPTLNGKKFSDPVTEIVKNNTTELWSIANLTPDTHPIHPHLVHAQIVDRRPFDVDAYNATGVINYTGPAVPPAPHEGYKDTMQMHPGEVTRIMMTFNSFTGRYVWHCHILEHEEYDMMRYMTVMP